MTKTEMDNYLVSIGGLVRTWRVDKGSIVNANFFEISEGWYPMVKTIIDELITLGWNRKISQVKEKFGGLRFYAVDIPDGGDVIIAKYETLSYKTCETCGKEGSRRKGDWIKTLCDEHSNDRERF